MPEDDKPLTAQEMQNVVLFLLHLEEDFVFWMKLGYIFVVASGFDACESVVCGG